MVKFLRLEPAASKYKYYAVFENDKGREKKVGFGAQGAMDFIQYSKENKDKAQQRKDAYIARHKVNEDWTDPMRAGTLSRYILWSEPTLHASLADYRRRFNL
jgi:hypothetical protein